MEIDPTKQQFENYLQLPTTNSSKEYLLSVSQVRDTIKPVSIEPPKRRNSWFAKVSGWGTSSSNRRQRSLTQSERKEFMQDLARKAKEIMNAPYFSDMTQEQANQLLMEQPGGTFLIRPSSEKGFFVLTYKNPPDQPETADCVSVRFFISPQGKIQIPPLEKSQGFVYETMTGNQAFFSGNLNVEFVNGKGGLLDVFLKKDLSEGRILMKREAHLHLISRSKKWLSERKR